MESKIVIPNLLLIRLAQTVGYNLFMTKELILTEVLEVASSNRFARCILCL